MNNHGIQLIQISVKELQTIIQDAFSAELEKVTKSKPTGDLKQESELLTREEAKDLLKISYTTLWKFNNNGTLRSRKLGHKVYYLRQDVFGLLGEVKDSN